MKKILLSIAAASALAAAAAPALAQDYGHHDGYGGYTERQDVHRDGDRYDRGGGYGGIDMRQARAEERIDRGMRTGRLTRREAWVLRSQARDIARLEARYRYNGLSGWERADLNRRLDRLEMRISYQAHDGDRYGNR